MEEHDKKVLDLAMRVGAILLECGAELTRVEDTIGRIAAHYGITDSNPFVLSNAIFLTGENREEQMYSKIWHIPISGVRLNRIDAVNQLSREIAADVLTLEEAQERLSEIEKMPEKSNFALVLSSGVGAAAFCYVVGGSLMDCAASFISGLVLYIFLLILGKREKITAKLLRNIAGAFLSTCVGIGMWHIGIGNQPTMIAVGAIMPLIPGVSFVNAIRDYANEGYLSGTIRLIDTVIVTLGIAMGVAGFFIIYTRMGGVVRI